MRHAVTRITLSPWVSAETVVSAFGAHGDVVWFDAGVSADAPEGSPPEGHPRRSLVGWGDDVLTARATQPGSVEAAWARLAASTAEDASESESVPSDPLGWWGFLGYGVGAAFLAPGDPGWAEALSDPEHPDLALLDVDRALVFDHDTGVIDLVLRGDHGAWRDSLVDWWQAQSQMQPQAQPQPQAQGSPRGGAAVRRPVAEWVDEGSAYLGLIERCQDAIREGDAFVMCLTTSARVTGIAEPDLTVYGRLRRSSPAPRAAFVRIGGVAVLSASPETFLTVDRDRVASTSPIKGTRPRGRDSATDIGLVAELRDSAKEQAENLMIVDLMRNDLSRVAVPGSVDVTELFAVRSYAHVHQLISTLRGRLRPGMTGVDAVRAAFPPGSMTGAPKHRVVDLLGQWESEPRGIYSGAVGRFGLDGSVDLSVVIRSIVVDAASGIARIGVGGGITSASEPAEELAEIRTKAAALLDALGVSAAPEQPEPALGRPRSTGPAISR